MGGKEAVISRISWQQVALRRAMFGVSEILWPHRLEQVGSGLSRAQQLLQSGSGVVLLINHFSLRDGPEAVKDVIFGQKVLRERMVTGPIAAHQWGSLSGKLAEIFGVTIVPVVNEHSIQKGFARERKGEGILRYVTRAAEVLSGGGVVLLAPQAGREFSLYPVRERTVEMFMRQMQRKHVVGVGYLLVGLGVAGESNYTGERVGGYNIGRVFDIKLGDTFLDGEILEQSKATHLSIDQWIYQRFESLVPVTYATGFVMALRGDSS